MLRILLKVFKDAILLLLGNIIHKFVATISSLILWPLPFGLHLEKGWLKCTGR